MTDSTSPRSGYVIFTSLGARPKMKAWKHQKPLAALTASVVGRDLGQEFRLMLRNENRSPCFLLRNIGSAGGLAGDAARFALR